MVAGRDRHLHADAGPPVEAGSDRQHDAVLGRGLVLARRQQQAGAPHPVGLELLDHDLVEQGPKLLPHSHEDMRPIYSYGMADEARPPAPPPARPPRGPNPGDPRADRAPQKQPMIPWSGRRFLVILISLFVLNWLIVAIFAPAEQRIRVPYNPTFLAQVRDGNVKEISSKGDTIQGEFKKDVKYKGDKATNFETEIPTFADDTQLSQLLTERTSSSTPRRPTAARCSRRSCSRFGPTILLVALFIFLFRRAAGGAGGGGVLGQFGRSRAKRVESETQTVNFDDVAGIDEAEEQLVEVVDFLRHPEKYAKLGARIPRGVLLAGSPGTGKTLLARAVAGEAGVPFFSASASEFIEAIVGVGASRVRDLFKQAEEAAPAIIFIDELDAIGRARGGSGGVVSGHDEREQTLNQILTEMDGFDPAAA